LTPITPVVCILVNPNHKTGAITALLIDINFRIGGAKRRLS
jgi:hypothetical protein